MPVTQTSYTAFDGHRVDKVVGGTQRVQMLSHSLYGTQLTKECRGKLNYFLAETVALTLR
jgi:hypothetical protein